MSRLRATARRSNRRHEPVRHMGAHECQCKQRLHTCSGSEGQRLVGHVRIGGTATRVAYRRWTNRAAAHITPSMHLGNLHDSDVNWLAQMRQDIHFGQP